LDFDKVTLFEKDVRLKLHYSQRLDFLLVVPHQKVLAMKVGLDYVTVYCVVYVHYHVQELFWMEFAIVHLVMASIWMVFERAHRRRCYHLSVAVSWTVLTIFYDVYWERFRWENAMMMMMMMMTTMASARNDAQLTQALQLECIDELQLDEVYLKHRHKQVEQDTDPQVQQGME